MSKRYEYDHVVRPGGPITTLRLVASDEGMCGIYFRDHRKPQAEPAQVVESHPRLDRARAQLEQYWAGEREHFDLALAPAGTEFQRQVWAALAEIPFGETRSYADIAAAIGRPSAVRAVGMANGRNPLSIVVPCHRVIGSNGTLTGYAGGVELKRWLLVHEGHTQYESPRQGELSLG